MSKITQRESFTLKQLKRKKQLREFVEITLGSAGIILVTMFFIAVLGCSSNRTQPKEETCAYVYDLHGKKTSKVLCAGEGNVLFERN